jgi:hypothetical protein
MGYRLEKDLSRSNFRTIVQRTYALAEHSIFASV